MDLIIAGGYPNTYGGEAAEFAWAQQERWFPTTTDFRVTGAQSGQTGEVKTFVELLDWIAAKDPGSIEGLALVGHASPETFSLAGKVSTDTNNIYFSKPGMIHPVSLKDHQARITALQDRFAEKATITLYACHAGVGKPLMDAISSAFNRCVLAFTNEIVWCIQSDSSKRKITSRGRTFYDANGLQARPDCGGTSFSANIRDWGTDQKSCPKAP